jgi:hypothetical protein
MRRRSLLATSLLVPLPFQSLPSPAAETPPDCGEPLLSEAETTPRQRALVAVVLAAERAELSAGFLYEVARVRSGFDPLRRRQGIPRYHGLFAFTETQWKEEHLAMGLPWPQVFALDIMDIQRQAEAAAFVYQQHRKIRGDPNG